MDEFIGGKIWEIRIIQNQQQFLNYINQISTNL